MPWAGAKTTWVAGEMVSPDDLNRIEGNIEEAFLGRNLGFVGNAVDWNFNSTDFASEPYLKITHTPLTGRTLTIVRFSVTSSIAQLYQYALLVNGARNPDLVRLNGSTFSGGTLLAADTGVFLSSGIPTGSPIVFQIEFKLISGSTAVTVKGGGRSMVVIDI